jgi:hypothetical protein
MRGYKPALSWILKRRSNGTLASDFVCFVDDLQITGQGCWQVREAGHAISLQQSYLGIQDALWKLRLADGTRRMGAWAGVNMCVEAERGVVVLTSQEKWDCMKAICEHWWNLLKQGETNLDFKQLQLDRGFMVYVTQAYPGMKSYLKDFHLSLETWRGGRDSEGWKLPKQREQGETKSTETTTSDNFLDLKLNLLMHLLIGGDSNHDAPLSGFT